MNTVSLRLCSRLSVFVLVLALILSPAIARKVHGAPPYSITGMVFDMTATRMLAGATVTAYYNGSEQPSATAVTDGTGGFILSPLADTGQYVVSAAKDGYTLQAPIPVSVPDSQQPVPLPGLLVMTQSQPDTGPPFTIRGTVQDVNTWQALPAATVTIYFGDSEQPSGTAVTDGTGGFIVPDLTDIGVYWVSAAKDGYTLVARIPVTLGLAREVSLPSPVFMAQASDLTLAVGWNFVSLPRKPNDTAIGEVLADILGKVRIVWSYDNRTKQWLKFRPSASDNTLLFLEPGPGYWIYMEQEGTIDMSLWWPLGKHSARIFQGWNLVGYNGNNNVAIASTLGAIAGKWSLLWNWSADQWYAHPAPPGLSIPVLGAVQQGKAYWIKVKEDTKWFQFNDGDDLAQWVIGSTPLDKTEKLPVTTSAEIRMWNDLDPSTVNMGNITFSGNGEHGLIKASGSLSYDDARNSIIFQPLGDLGNGFNYTLTLKEGVIKDTSGDTMFNDYKLTFSTLKNQLKNYWEYNPDGTVKGYGTYEFDANGNLAKHVHYGPGGAVSYYETYAVIPGFSKQVTRFDDPGTDAAWFTFDDVQSSSSGYTYDNATGRATQADYGSLQMEYTYGAEGLLLRRAFGDNTGTGAERYVFYDKILYDGNGIKTGEISYKGPGADNQWFTEDDEAGTCTSYTYAGGLLTRMVLSKPGVDGTPFTGDDVVQSYWTYTYANGLLVRKDLYGHPGVTPPDGNGDGIWFTGDDVIFEYTVYTYDGAKNKTQSARYGWPGPDGFRFTGDDVKYGFFEYDTAW